MLKVILFQTNVHNSTLPCALSLQTSFQKPLKHLSLAAMYWGFHYYSYPFLFCSTVGVKALNSWGLVMTFLIMALSLAPSSVLVHSRDPNVCWMLYSNNNMNILQLEWKLQDGRELHVFCSLKWVNAPSKSVVHKWRSVRICWVHG